MSARSTKPIDEAREAALLQYVTARGGRLRLTRSHYFALDDRGLTRPDVGRAVNRLAEARALRLSAEDGSVVIELPAEVRG